MKLSAIFDEQILNQLSIDEWIHFCTSLNIHSLEYSPEPSVLPLKVYKTLIKKQRTNGVKATLHAPYFAKKFNPKAIAYDLSYFRKSPLDFKDCFNQLFEYIYPLESASTLTIHGAKHFKEYGANMVKTSRDDTWFGIEYLLNKLECTDLPITLCIELSGPESHSYLTSRDQVLETISKFGENNLKTCWDLAHDYSLKDSICKPSKVFMDSVSHVHIHGIDPKGNKHFDLHKSTIDYDPMIKFLKENNYENDVVVEILMNTIENKDDYLKTLNKDIELLSKKI